MLTPEVITITFADGSKMIVGLREWEQAWDDVITGRPNEIFQRLKDQRDQGNTDRGGIINLMEAYEPKTIAEVWESDKPLSPDVL